jgi:hypothetical protein
MPAGVLGNLLLKILVETFLAADEAGAIVMSAEQLDPRRGSRCGHPQPHGLLVAPGASVQISVDRRRVQHSLGEGQAIPQTEINHFLIDNGAGSRILRGRDDEFGQGLSADVGAALKQPLCSLLSRAIRRCDLRLGRLLLCERDAVM